MIIHIHDNCASLITSCDFKLISLLIPSSDCAPAVGTSSYGCVTAKTHYVLDDATHHVAVEMLASTTSDDATTVRARRASIKSHVWTVNVPLREGK